MGYGPEKKGPTTADISLPQMGPVRFFLKMVPEKKIIFSPFWNNLGQTLHFEAKPRTWTSLVPNVPVLPLFGVTGELKRCCCSLDIFGCTETNNSPGILSSTCQWTQWMILPQDMAHRTVPRISLGFSTWSQLGPVVYLVRGPDARIPTATVQQHIFHILCRWQEFKKSEQRMPTEHGKNTAHTWHIPGLSLVTSRFSSWPRLLAGLVPKTVPWLLPIPWETCFTWCNRPTGRRSFEIPGGRSWCSHLCPRFLYWFVGFWCIIYTLIYTI